MSTPLILSSSPQRVRQIPSKLTPPESHEPPERERDWTVLAGAALSALALVPGEVQAQQTQTSIQVPQHEQQSTGNWTVMVYSPDGSRTQGWSEAALEKGTRVVVLEPEGESASLTYSLMHRDDFDPSQAGFLAGGNPDSENVSQFLEQTPESNLGSAESLTAFVKQAMKEYPAQHYMLVVEGQQASGGVIATDARFDDPLTARELGEALDELPIDVLYLDGADQAQLPTLEQLGSVDYLVAPQGSLGEGIFPAWTLHSLSMAKSPRDAVHTMASNQHFWMEGHYESLTAVELNGIVGKDLTDFCEALEKEPQREPVQELASRFTSEDQQLDLLRFLDALAGLEVSPSLLDASQRLNNELHGRIVQVGGQQSQGGLLLDLATDQPGSEFQALRELLKP